MIYGFTWDYALYWLTQTSELRIYDMRQSRLWGNFIGTTFKYENSSGTIVTKSCSQYSMIPTGSSSYTKANNIYDLAGNVSEWVQACESSSSDNRLCKGNYY